MSLDLHLGKKKNEAENKFPSLSFDEVIHEILFDSNKKYIQEHVLFMKMADYYTDTSYNRGDIEKLIVEVSTIESTMKNPRVHTFLNNFKKVCEVAIKSNENIYCFCD